MNPKIVGTTLKHSLSRLSPLDHKAGSLSLWLRSDVPARIHPSVGKLSSAAQLCRPSATKRTRRMPLVLPRHT